MVTYNDVDYFYVYNLQGDVVSFFSHKLYLRLSFLFLTFDRLVLLHTLIHFALDFAQNITH